MVRAAEYQVESEFLSLDIIPNSLSCGLTTHTPPRPVQYTLPQSSIDMPAASDLLSVSGLQEMRPSPTESMNEQSFRFFIARRRE